MTFKEQYEEALTIKTDAFSENIPGLSHFAGTFYELHDTAAYRLPTVLCGGSIEPGASVSLSYRPLDCRMLLYTEEGAGALQLRGQTHPLTPGSLLYLDCSRSPFSLSAGDSRWSFINFSLGGGLFSVYESLIPFEGYLLTAIDEHSPALRSIRQLLSGEASAFLPNKLKDAQLITTVLTALFSEGIMADAEKERPDACAPYLRELKHFIDNHSDSPLGLADLERHSHMSKYRICHEFSAAFGLPPLKYLRKKRMEAAENLLLSTEKKVHEIALEIGYENTNHFINLFKKEYGATPQAYREAHRI